MKQILHRCGVLQAGVLFALALAMATTAAAQAAAPQQLAIATPPPRDASMEEYRAHLQALVPIVEACTKARDTRTCDGALVGPDDRVPLKSGRRLIRYAWLRALLTKAQVIDKKAAKPQAKAAPADEDDDDKPDTLPNTPLTTEELLKEAVERLNSDIEQAGGTFVPAEQHGAERASMQKVLSANEYAYTDKRSLRDAILEDIGNWLNNLLEKATSHRIHSPWVGRVLVGGFIALVCIGLVWGLLQMERRWRIRLVPESDGPAPGAASARDWQLWLQDARQAAANGAWRDAIHSVYWAAISRLESRKLWPADRARTPREYLALVAGDDARKPRLAQLTGSFERTWYGGRPAEEGDYRNAEQLAEELMDAGAGRGKGGRA
ncbi:MAG TPA: DUF4129 domain-containing protein [Terracidiphilus sp.]